MTKHHYAGLSAMLIFTLAAGHVPEALAEPTNFAYTRISAGLGVTRFRTSDICVANECFNNGTGRQISGGIQFADDFLVLSGGTHSRYNERNASSVYVSDAQVRIGLVASVTGRADLQIGASALASHDEKCVSTGEKSYRCDWESDKGKALDIGLSLWWNQARSLAANLGLSRSKWSDSDASHNTASFGVEYYFDKHHVLSYLHSHSRTRSDAGISYSYHF